MSCTPPNYSIQSYTFFDFRRRAQSPLFPILASCHQQLKAVSLCTNDRRTHFSSHSVDNTEIRTPPTPGATTSIVFGVSSNRFQSTPPHWGRPFPCIQDDKDAIFQPTPHARGDLAPHLVLDHLHTISTHAPTPGATRPAAWPVVVPCHCFNPRPHTGGDAVFLQNTFFPRGFNPRPHTGGDHGLAPILHRGIDFNPRPHTGGDQMSVNIPPVRDHFNPRPHTGGDHLSQVVPGRGDRFQPTPPHRGRRAPPDCNISKRNFNPRPHTGGDSNSISRLKNGKFQPTPPHRGRRSKRWREERQRPFQPTPPHRGRPSHAQTIAQIEGHFNPRPHTGGDPIQTTLTLVTPSDFNPRPHTGGDETRAQLAPLAWIISTHAPTPGATHFSAGSCC